MSRTDSWHVNQLTAVTHRDSNNTVTKSVTYRYDAVGRRIGKSVDETGDGIVDRSESYIYDGAGLLADANGSIHISGPNGETNQHGWVDQMVLMFEDADGDGSGTAALAARNLYGPAVDQIFATEVASGDVLWALSDHQGTVRDWATFDDTASTTSVETHIRYSSFGAIDSVTDGSGNPLASSLIPPASFTGQLYDADADLLYYRARWYDPQLGKFINDDLMGFEAGDANVSRYVGNGVTTARDATGLQELVVKPKPPVQTPRPLPETWNWRNRMIEEYGRPAITVLPKLPQEHYTPGGSGSLFFNVPEEHYVGVGGAEPCILVIVVSPKCPGCGNRHFLTYHFNTSHDPRATLTRDEALIPDGSHVLIGAGDNTPESNATLLSTTMYFVHRPEVTIDGIVDTTGVMVDNDGEYYTYKTAVELWGN